MIIKRKLFTIQDKKVIKEVWRTTNGLRDLPRGYKNLTPRDVFRLSNVTEGYNQVRKGVLDGINYEELSTIAKHLGLPETAKGAEHLIKKYNNPALLERYRRIKASQIKLSKSGNKRLNEFRELSKQREADRKEVDAALNDMLNHSRKPIDYNAPDWREQSRKWQEESSRLRHRYDELDRNYDRVWEYGGKKYKEMEKLKERVEKEYEKATVSPKTKKRLKEITKRSQDGVRDSAKKFLHSVSPAPQLATEIREEAVKRGFPVEVQKGRGAESRTDLGNIYLNRKHANSPGIIGHELGHNLHLERLGRIQATPLLTRDAKQAYVRSRGDAGFFGYFGNPVYHLGNEYGATANGLARLRRLRSATPLEMANAEKELTNAYKSYYHSAIGEIPDGVYSRIIPEI